MTRISLKGLWARKRRMLGTLLAVFLGVSFLSGTLVLGDTLNANFDTLFSSVTRGTDAVVPFYADVLGLRHVEKPTEGVAQSGAWFDIDDQSQVHVSERDGAVHPQSHFGLVVDEFDDVLRRLHDAGAPWEDQADIFGGRRGFTRDPAGNRVEILEQSGQLA